MGKHLSIGQAAEMLGVSRETLRRWDKSGRFPSQRHPINNYRVYPVDHVNQFVNELQADFLIEKRPSRLGPADFGTDLGKLYHRDAVEFLQGVETSSVQLVFADPPYNIKKAQWDTFQSQKAYVDWSLEWIEEVHRVLDPNGSLYVCGFSEILADVKWAASSIFAGCKWLVWYYRNKANLANDWGRSHESLLHFRKSKKFTFNLDTVRVPYNAHTLKYPRHPQAETSQYGNGKEYVWTPHPNGAKPKDVLEIPTLSNSSWERMDHPTQKPVELVKKCILASSKPSDVVLDPFGGSGTTFAVAEAFGRRWLGSEESAEYCEMIQNRLTDRAHIDRIRTGSDECEAIERRKKLRG